MNEEIKELAKVQEKPVEKATKIIYHISPDEIAVEKPQQTGEIVYHESK